MLLAISPCFAEVYMYGSLSGIRGTGLSGIVLPPAPAAPWTPKWAVVLNANRVGQYVNSGLYVSSNWTVRCLINIRSNKLANATSGIGESSIPMYWYFGHGTTAKWTARYGTGPLQTSTATPETNQYQYVICTTTNNAMYLLTNGVVILSFTASVGPQYTRTFFIGDRSSSALPSVPCHWDIARFQFLSNSVVVQDLIATGNGNFTNVLDGAVYAVTNGVGSSDSVDISGWSIPSMSW